jgi:hypothetical protein
MLRSLGGRLGTRKARLFAAGCVRRVWHLLADERSRRMVEVVERLADGPDGDGQLEAARAAARAAFVAADAAWHAAAEPAGSAGATAAIAACYADDPATAPLYAVHAAADDDEARAAEQATQAHLLREVLGPAPFHPVVVAPSWLAWKGGLVVRLARRIYESRRFDELPGLAFALEQAGCTDEEILGHCRMPGGHIRGCWVLDRLLGKD